MRQKMTNPFVFNTYLSTLSLTNESLSVDDRANDTTSRSRPLIIAWYRAGGVLSSLDVARRTAT